MMRLLILSLLILGFSINADAQQRIALYNYSFEANGPDHSMTPEDWTNCGPRGESPPDIHGYDTDFFGLSFTPQQGDNFLGMVTRTDGTTEGISQRLNNSLEKGKVYWFSLFMARSSVYKSITRESIDVEANLTAPTKIKIWGGTDPCAKEQLLAESNIVDHENWLEYEFILEPVDNWDYLMLEASHGTPLSPEYGHLLIDNCSDIVELINDSKESALINYTEAELAQLDAPTIIELATECVTYRSEAGYEYPISLKLISAAAAFHKQQNTNGLRSYIVSNDLNDISTMIRILERLNIQSPTEILKKTTLIYQKRKKEEDLSETDYQYFENSDEAFLAALQKESVLDKLNEYIQLHKGEIVGDLVGCQ